MLRTSAIVLALGLALCAGGNARAESDLLGLGTAPCKAFSAARGGAGEVAMMSWVTGWLSGMNAARLLMKQPAMNFEPMPYNAMLDYVRSYCGSHPKAKVVEAAIALVGQIADH